MSISEEQAKKLEEGITVLNTILASQQGSAPSQQRGETDKKNRKKFAPTQHNYSMLCRYNVKQSIMSSSRYS